MRLSGHSALQGLSCKPSWWDHNCQWRHIGRDEGGSCFQLVFIIRVSFVVKGLWINHWNIKTLLSNMQTSAPASRNRQRSAICYKRLSQLHFSLHSAYMASRAYHGFNEGDQLRQELVQLTSTSELLRSCAHSTGSQRLSSDSTGQVNNIDLDITQAKLQ